MRFVLAGVNTLLCWGATNAVASLRGPLQMAPKKVLYQGQDCMSKAPPGGMIIFVLPSNIPFKRAADNRYKLAKRFYFEEGKDRLLISFSAYHFQWR